MVERAPAPTSRSRVSRPCRRRWRSATRSAGAGRSGSTASRDRAGVRVRGPRPGSSPQVGERGAGARIAIVTGASAGIGLYTALGLARAGMRVIMTGRDAARTEAARRFVAERASGAQVETALADFACSGRGARASPARSWPRTTGSISWSTTPGCFHRKFERPRDGYEMTFAVNHLAPFLLTNLLLDRLQASAPARDRHRRLARPSRRPDRSGDASPGRAIGRC